MNTKPLYLLLLVIAPGLLSQAASSYTYDLNNRVTLADFAEGQQAAFKYDETGNILSITAAQTAPPAVLISHPLYLHVGNPMPDYEVLLSRASVIRSYSVKGLPPGLKANLSSKVNKDARNPGTIYGTPAKEGVYKVSISASTTAGKTAAVTLMVHVENPFSKISDGFSLAGLFSGTLPVSEITQDLGGSLVIKTTAAGSFTGTVTIGQKKYKIKGSFNPLTGVAEAVTITRKSPDSSLTLNLVLDLSTTSVGRGSIAGTLSDGSVTVGLGAFRQVWSKTLPAAFFAEGKGSSYNTALFLEPDNLTDEDYPQGVSFAVIKVDRLGKVKLTSRLADGTKFTSSTILWPDGQLPLYIPLYKGQGSLVGTLILETGFAEDIVADNEVTGDLKWTRPASSAKLYADGFITLVSASGGVYLAPPKGSRVLDLGSDPDHPSVQMNLTQGGLAGTIAADLALTTASKVSAITPNDNKVKLTFAPATGLVSGGFAVDKRKAPISGLILPANGLNESEAYGFFLLPPASGGQATLSGFFSAGRP
ncbi:hypothetical protein WJU23_03990 [Prosthecobacter sp. SYSU 5D2]|uniref:hypothetical protein n=1 Tax=Prosthecobacter sp. SYSU 5D2 TaxID=3134134 RepID=UPI0031FE6293